MLTKLSVVIISRHIRISNHYTYMLNVYNVICQLYLNKVGGWGGGQNQNIIVSWNSNCKRVRKGYSLDGFGD